MTMHCTRPPSHCRRACTSSVFSSSFFAWSHCSNWSRTISTFLPAGMPCPRRRAARVSFSPRLAGRAGQCLRSPFRSRASVSSRRRLDVNGDASCPKGEATDRPSPATTCRTPKARRSGPREGVVRRPSPRCGSSRSGCCRAALHDREGREAVRGRSRRHGRRKNADPLGTILTGWLSEVDVGNGLGVGVAAGVGEGIPTTGTRERRERFSSSVACWKKCRRSSAMSLPVV